MPLGQNLPWQFDKHPSGQVPASWPLLFIFCHANSCRAAFWFSLKPNLVHGAAWCLCCAVCSTYPDNFSPHAAFSDYSLSKQVEFEQCPIEHGGATRLLCYVPASRLLFSPFSQLMTLPSISPSQGREQTRNNLAVLMTILFRRCLQDHGVIPALSQVLRLKI